MLTGLIEGTYSFPGTPVVDNVDSLLVVIIYVQSKKALFVLMSLSICSLSFSLNKHGRPSLRDHEYSAPCRLCLAELFVTTQCDR